MSGFRCNPFPVISICTKFCCMILQAGLVMSVNYKHAGLHVLFCLQQCVIRLVIFLQQPSLTHSQKAYLGSLCCVPLDYLLFVRHTVIVLFHTVICNTSVKLTIFNNAICSKTNGVVI